MSKPSKSEEEFFAREDIEKRYRLHEQKVHERDEQEKNRRKKLHYMKCPKCGDDLHSFRLGYVDVHKCFSCGVYVLESDELERIIEEEKSILKSLVEVFRSHPKE